MLRSVRLRNFRNHADFRADLGRRTVLSGSNGSGKTSVLEAVYCLLNASFAFGRPIDEVVSVGAESSAITGVLSAEGGAYGETYVVSLDPVARKARLSREKAAASRPDYLARSPLRAVLFHPAEMNILSLAPSLRRDFLDEILSTAHPEFSVVRREYAQALTSRNKMLKAIRERKTSPDDLDLWDRLFAERAGAFLGYRLRLIDELRAFVPEIERILANRYRLIFSYESRADPRDPEGSILRHCRTNRDRDILTGHASAGPHTDDLVISACDSVGYERRASEYLSRGETKTLLLGLKAFQVSYIRSGMNKEIVLLFDDLFSELDRDHVDFVLSLFPHEQAIFTSQSERGEAFASASGASVVSL
ncbi:MAG TPA: DNA replication and repair protein RecF [bacterium]|nr:DNA replication and repair protein RecF [bacterium]